VAGCDWQGTTKREAGADCRGPISPSEEAGVGHMKDREPGMVVHTCSSTTWQRKEEREFRPSWLHSEILSPQNGFNCRETIVRFVF
jgi:hypothetical protein